MSRSEASPEADPTSYSPVFISETISSEVPAIFVLTLQPVSFSKSCTQSTLGSFVPSSTYPAQATMLTWPSPAPSAASLSIFGRLAPPGPAPEPPPPEPPPPEPPQPASASAPAASTEASALPLCRIRFLLRRGYLDDVLLVPAQPDRRAARRGGCGAPVLLDHHYPGARVQVH